MKEWLCNACSAAGTARARMHAPSRQSYILAIAQVGWRVLQVPANAKHGVRRAKRSSIHSVMRGEDTTSSERGARSSLGVAYPTLKARIPVALCSHNAPTEQLPPFLYLSRTGTRTRKVERSTMEMISLRNRVTRGRSNMASFTDMAKAVHFAIQKRSNHNVTILQNVMVS